MYLLSSIMHISSAFIHYYLISTYFSSLFPFQNAFMLLFTTPHATAFKIIFQLYFFLYFRADYAILKQWRTICFSVCHPDNKALRCAMNSSVLSVFLRIGDDFYKELQCPAGTLLLDLLRKHNIAVPTPCGGNGICGKCRVTLLLHEGNSGEDLNSGEVLACRYRITGDCTVILPAGLDYFTVNFFAKDTDESSESLPYGNPSSLGAAIDIGTTTVAIQLVALYPDGSHRILKTGSFVNPQNIYGADVLSRIQNAENGALADMSALIRSSLSSELADMSALIRSTLSSELAAMSGSIRGTLATELGCLPEGSRHTISSVVIAANTAMTYLLLGYPCGSLGHAPFDASLTLNTITIPAGRLFSGCESAENIFAPNAEVTVLPGISAFIGGDIISGLLKCRPPVNSLFIDLGTNGEMALTTESGILCTSAAAGPAFEGGNISCGVGSVEGAIAHVSLKNGIDKPLLKLISTDSTTFSTVTSPAASTDSAAFSTVTSQAASPKSPVGLCGTGLVDAVAELLPNYLDETGLLAEPYFTNGVTLWKDISGKNPDITLTQRDIRELQLAKSAIRAGTEILLRHAGLSCSDIGTVFLAGGFGSTLSTKSAAGIGLIHNELSKKVITVGNSALAGAVYALSHKKEALETVTRITACCREISLASDKDFQNYFLKYMSF